MAEINNTKSNTLLSGTNGDDSIQNGYYNSSRNRHEGGYNVTIDGDAGNDYISNYGDNSKLDGGDGDDSILNDGFSDDVDGEHIGNKTSINGGAGNDYIHNWGDNVTISGGGGDDTIHNDGFYDDYDEWLGGDGVLFQYTLGDGNDLIEGFRADSTLNISGGTYSTQISGKDFLITVGESTVTLDNVLLKTKVININDKAIPLEVKNIELTDDNDTLDICISSITVDAGAGNDSIVNDGYMGAAYWNDWYHSGIYVTIDSGDGNDFIVNLASIDEEYDYSDYFDSEAECFVMINSGKGNDSISNEGNKVLIIYDSGNDYISGFKPDSTLQIRNGTGTYTTLASGNDIIVCVGEDSISLVGATTLSTINIDGKELTLNKKSDSSVTLPAQTENINASSRTKAVKITGNELDNSILGGSGADTLWGGAGNDTLTGGKGNDIFVFTDGNDVITDYASGDKISLGAAVSKAFVKGSNVIFTVGSGSLTIKDGKAKSLSMIDSKGKSFSTILGGSTKLTVTDKTKSPVTVDSSIKTINASKRTTAVKITGNALANSIKGGSANDTLDDGKGNDTIYGGKGNDYISGGSGNDKLFGETGNDTLRGNSGNDTLTGGKGYDVFICGSGKDVITDYATGDKISLGAAISKSSISGSDVVFTIGKGSLIVKNGTDKNITVIDKNGNESVKKYSTKLTVTNKTKSPVTIGSAIKTINASKRTKAVKITGNALDNTINGGSNNDSIYGGKGNDSIVGNAGNDKIFGQDGADTLGGGTGNDTLTGGNGNDLFIYSAGKDVIADYATEDKISLGAAISKASISGSNVIFTIGKGSLTVKNGTDKNITVVDKNGNESVKKYSTTLTVTNSTNSPVTVGSAIKTIDASSRTSGIKITGNALANTINGGKGNDSILGGAGNDKLYGQAGNDSLWGGAGNDSLWGDAGNDTFIYAKGDGKDVIYGFENNDMLKITGAFSASYNKRKKELAFKVGSTASAITLKDFGSTSSFNINGTNYKISGTKLIKK